MPPDRKRYFAGIRRAVIKVGSNVLTTASGLNLTAIEAAQIEVITRGDVRRARLYYLRERRGNAAKIRERRDNVG